MGACCVPLPAAGDEGAFSPEPLLPSPPRAAGCGLSDQCLLGESQERLLQGGGPHTLCVFPAPRLSSPPGRAWPRPGKDTGSVTPAGAPAPPGSGRTKRGRAGTLGPRPYSLCPANSV